MCIYYSDSLVYSITKLQEYQQLGWYGKAAMLQQMVNIDIVNTLRECV